MRVSGFNWDEDNISHIARHGVRVEEVEEACFALPFVLRGRQNRYYVLGRTSSGRYLAIVIEAIGQGIVRVITARDMTQVERKRYIKR